MGEFSKWLLHEDQKELFDYLFAIVLNAVFLVLIAVLLWPLGRAMMTLRLAKGYWVFWGALILTACVLFLLQRFFRMDLYSHFDAYVICGLIVGGFLQVGWSAFVAPVVHSSLTGASIWLTIIIYGVGVISCYVAFVIVSAFFLGTLYRMVNAALAFLSFIIFSVWPNAGSVVYGWFFALFDSFS
jgi:hypothetical protein